MQEGRLIREAGRRAFWHKGGGRHTIFIREEGGFLHDLYKGGVSFKTAIRNAAPPTHTVLVLLEIEACWKCVDHHVFVITSDRDGMEWNLWHAVTSYNTS